MPTEPVVSVIIPTYNRAGFISDAVQSVLDQTYKNIEIIVVDDGSTDGTKDVLAPFMDNIRYYYTENSGAAHARNIGLKAAVGKYIAFLDSDDAYLPYKLELQVSFMESHPEAGMVFTEVSSTDGKSILEEYHLRTFHSLYNRKGWSYDDLYPVKGELTFKPLDMPVPYYIGDIFKYTLLGTFVFSNTALFPAEVLKKTGYQNEAYRVAEDYELMVRICKHYKVGFLNIPTYIYLYHDDQISMVNQAITKKKLAKEIEIEEVIIQTVLDWGYSDGEYYSKNKEWLDRHLAEMHLCAGQKWLEYGDPKRAREYFKKGLSFDPSWHENRRYLYASFLPPFFRRVYFGIRRHLK